MDSKDFQSLVIVKLDKLDDKIDKIEDKMSEQSVVLGKQEITLSLNTESLQEHIRRTNILEEKVALVEHHVTRVETIGKTIGKIAAVLSIVVSAIWTIFTFFVK